MRLGDLDALEAEIRENIRRYYSMEKEVRSGYCTAQDADDEVKYAPTIDAVTVVRCKDCEFSHMDGWFCGGAGMMPEHTTLPESFCDHGERKEGAADG